MLVWELYVGTRVTNSQAAFRERARGSRRRPVYFSSSSPSLMLLMDAEAPLGEVGGEGRAVCQRAGGDGGDGERRGDSSRGGLLQGDSLGDRA